MTVNLLALRGIYAMIYEPPDSIIFMKVGNHARENFESILERKLKEYETTGKIFWGYGGVTCHPINQVQPFAKQHLEKQGSLYIMMQYIDSNADPDILPAEQYSVDGVNWSPIPKGITVTGSRYAMILGEIKPGDLIINPSEYEVGVGSSRGKNAHDYIKGHVDKGCFVRKTLSDVRGDVEKQIKISYQAEVLEPYAVLLR